MPHFIKEIDTQDKAAKTPKNKAKLVKSFPMLIFIFYLLTKVVTAISGVAVTKPASFICCK